MGVIDKLKDRGQSLLAKEADELNRLQKTLRFGMRLTLHCTRQLAVCRAGQMAAALTYHTLFSLLPTIALMLVVARVFITDAQLDTLTNQAVDFSLKWLEESSGENVPEEEIEEAVDQADAAVDPDEANESTTPALAGPDEPGPDASSNPAAAARAGPGDNAADNAPPGDDLAAQDADDTSRVEAFDVTAQAVRAQIEAWIVDLKSINFGSIGVIGVAIFIYGATGLLATIERSFNRIYNAQNARPIQLRIPMYFTVLVLAPVVLTLGQVVSQQLQPYLMLDTLSGAAEQVGFVGGFFAWLGSVFSPLITTWFVLMAMYVLLPTARVSIKHAAIGATVAAVGWTLLVELFGLYVQRFTDEDGSGQGKLYGALALLPLFLLWLYLTWIIILFGFILTRTLQNLKGWEIERQREQSVAGQLVSPDAVVPAMALVAKRFDHGRTLDRDDLADELDLPVAAATRLVNALVNAGLLRRLADDDATPDAAQLALTRPPHRIPLAHVLKVGDDLARGGRHAGQSVARAVLDRLDRARRDAVAGQTLADAAELSGPATDPPDTTPTHSPAASPT